MSEKVQVGLRVDADLYERWKQAVTERCGRWKGAGGQELERMMREDIAAVSGEYDEIDPAALDDRLARIEAAVGVEATDGGTDPSQPREDTHTPSGGTDDVPATKPDPKGPSEAKVAWLADRYRQEYGTDDGELTKILNVSGGDGMLREIIDDEYAFNDDVAKRYVDKVIDYYDFVQHPEHDHKYVSQQRHDEIIEQKREQARSDARETTEQLEADE